MNSQDRQRIAASIAAHPYYQALVIYVFTALLSLIDRGGHTLGVGTTEHNAPWVLMTTSILFYAVCSSVLSLWAKNNTIYWRDAILTYVGLMIAAGLTAMLLSGETIDEAGYFRWIYIVLTIGYLVFVAIVRLIKKIVEIAIRQDDKLRGE